MKAVKLSLAAALVASSAFAVENVKVDGQLKLWYQTVKTDVSGSADLFDSKSATGDFVAKVRATGDLTKKVGFGVTLYGMSTLGLESNLVGNVASGDATNAGTSKVPAWLGEGYFTYKAGKTLAKIGRQELDTPLAFTETWNAAPNTFEAAVLVNQDLPDTTVVAAFVSKGNGNYASTVNGDGSFSLGYVGGTSLGNANSGAYALGLINKSIPNVTVTPYYYNVQDVTAAYWIDAVVTAVPMVKLEAQYANLDPYATGSKATSGYGVKASGSVAGVDLAAAYVNIGKGDLNIANTATLNGDFGGGRKTKMYTATIASDGAYAGAADSDSWKLSASTKLGDFKLGAEYGNYALGKESVLGSKYAKSFDTTELDLSVMTKIDEVNVALYYINQTNYASGATGASGLVDRDLIRVIASINF